MIRHSDGPKTCWGYYQDYLGDVFETKIWKKIPSIFSKNPKGIVLRKKMAETEVAADLKIWSKNWMDAIQ